MHDRNPAEGHFVISCSSFANSLCYMLDNLKLQLVGLAIIFLLISEWWVINLRRWCKGEERRAAGVLGAGRLNDTCDVRE